MATEPNTLVSAERAQAILDVCSVYPVGYPPIVAASVQLQKATCALLEAVPDLAETVIALHAEVKRLSTANIDLLDTLRAVARACTLPEDTAPASLPAQVEDCLRDLSGQIERLTRERDNAVGRVEQLSRVFTNTATALDAVELLSSVLAQDAAGAPNCTEWRGSYNGREFAITVQWVDGKSPHALIDEARRERDALRAEVATAQDSYTVLRTILTQGYTDATGDPEVAPDVPLIDLARAVCDSLGTLRAERDAEAAGRDALRRRMETMPPWRVSKVPTDEEMAALRLRWAFGPERYQADADALIAAVFHLRNEVARFTAERDRAVSSASWWEALGRDIGAKADALQAIVEGRATPPTDAEIHEHASCGGAWLVTLPAVKQVRVKPETRYTDDPREVSRLWWSEGARWVPVLNGRPTAWPVVTS